MRRGARAVDGDDSELPAVGDSVQAHVLRLHGASDVDSAGQSPTSQHLSGAPPRSTPSANSATRAMPHAT